MSTAQTGTSGVNISIPDNNGPMVYPSVAAPVNKYEDGDDKIVPVSELTPFSGLCCLFTSCNCDTDHCFGCASNGTVCCAKINFFGCKPTCDNPEVCCTLAESSCTLLPMNKCTGIQIKNQLFCLNARCAIPCDDEVPCIVSACFLTCCHKWSCKPAFFKTFGELDAM